jgi:hypothetical protein
MDDIASLVHSDVCHHVLFLAEAISEVKKAFPHVYQAVEIVYYSLAVLTGSNISFISCLGQSAKCLGSGRSLSQPHFSHNSGSNVPSSIEMMYLPSTGKNFQPWKLPHVATYKPLAAVCGEMMKSELDVKASLFKVSIWNRVYATEQLTSRFGASPWSSVQNSFHRRRGWRIGCPPSICSKRPTVRSRALPEVRIQCVQAGLLCRS